MEGRSRSSRATLGSLRCTAVFAFEPRKSHVYKEIHFSNEPNEPGEPKPSLREYLPVPGLCYIMIYDTGQRREASSSYSCHPATGPVLVFTSSESEKDARRENGGLFVVTQVALQ